MLWNGFHPLSFVLLLSLVSVSLIFPHLHHPPPILNHAAGRKATPVKLTGFLGPPQAMVATVNNLLQPQAQAAWRELSTGEQLRAATMLLDTVEQGAFVLADNLLKTDIVQENTDNIREYGRSSPYRRGSERRRRPGRSPRGGLTGSAATPQRPPPTRLVLPLMISQN